MPEPRPASLTPAVALALWNAALETEFGILLPVITSQQDRAKTFLYQARKIANDPRLDEVMLCAFPEEGELWFVKKTVEVL